MAEKPFFLPRKEVNLFDHLNQELIDDIIGQTVDIYKVKIDDTTSNIYGESDDGIKYFEKGFRVNCLIQFNEPEVEYEDFGADLNSSIEMFFHKTSLSGSDFYPEIGDVVDWNDFYWEIDGTSEPQLLQGHWDFKHQVKATAHRTRLSSVTFDERKM